MGIEMEERPVACGQAAERVAVADHSVDHPGRHAAVAKAPTVVGPVRGAAGRANSVG